MTHDSLRRSALALAALGLRSPPGADQIPGEATHVPGSFLELVPGPAHLPHDLEVDQFLRRSTGVPRALIDGFGRQQDLLEVRV